MSTTLRIRDFLSSQLLVDFESGDTTDATDLFATGLLDSYGFIELVQFLEGEFAIKLSDDELTSQGLSTVDQIAALVARKQVENG